MKTATDVGLQTWEADVTCGVWCQGGSVRWLKTDHPQYTDASDVWVRGDDAIAALESLRAELSDAYAEVHKQVAVSKVIFDRALVNRAKASLATPSEESK